MVFSISFDGACVRWKNRDIHDTGLILRDDIKKSKVVVTEIISEGIQVPQSKEAICGAPSPIEMEKAVAVVSVSDKRVTSTTITSILYGPTRVKAFHQ